jgi:large conductance mechanosensitive channel
LGIKDVQDQWTSWTLPLSNILVYSGVHHNRIIFAIVRVYRLSKADIPPEVRRKLSQEFFDFLKTFGIIGLAIAFVIGQAASRLVTAFVNDIIDPIIGFFLPAGSLETLSIKVTNLAGTTTEFKYGDLISNIIDFLIIALIVFLAYKQLSKFKLVEDKTKPAEEEKK